MFFEKKKIQGVEFRNSGIETTNFYYDNTSIILLMCYGDI